MKTIPNKPDRRRYTIDDDFFARENEATFYWAGFLAADGNVGYNSGCIKPTILQLKLSIRDFDHLQAFKDTVNATNPIRYDTLPNIDGELLTYCSMRITSAKMVQDLMQKFNVIPAKSLTYRFPKWLMKHPLVNHFLRGYVDGDGCFHLGKGRNENCGRTLSFYLLGTKHFLRSFNTILKGETGIDPTIHTLKNNKALRVDVKGNKQVPKLVSFLYRDASIFLGRKKDIAFTVVANRRKNLVRDRVSSKDIAYIRNSNLSARVLAEKFGLNQRSIYDIRLAKNNYG